MPTPVLHPPLALQAHTSTAAADLPTVLVARILKHVPQQERLSQCAVVCHAWAKAGTLATVIIDVKLPAGKRAAFESWLHQHSRQLEALNATKLPVKGVFYSPLQLQLPCDQLLQLSSLSLLEAVPHLQLPLQTNNSMQRSPVLGLDPASSSGPAAGMGPTQPAPVVLPKLQELSLQYMAFDSTSTLLQLTVLAGLTKLVLQGIHLAFQHGKNTLSTLVQRLPRLEDLTLDGQDLSLTDSLLAAMSSTRTDLPNDKSACQQRGPLTAVKHLELHHLSCHLPVLAKMVHLQHLELHCCTLLGFTADNVKVADADVGLAAWGGLQQLRHLKMHNVEYGVKEFPEQYAVLTASNHLTRFELLTEQYAGQLKTLGQDVMHHMFPPGTSLPQLQVLVIHNKPYSIPYMVSEPPGCITAAGLRTILSGCPHLTVLNVYGSLQRGDASPLLLLPPSCQRLLLTGHVDDAAAAVLCQPTQLTSLTWGYAHRLTAAGLEQLTALRCLKHLVIGKPQALSKQVAPDRFIGSNGQDGGAKDIELRARSKVSCQSLCDIG